MKEVRICVIGVGRWGINHVRTLSKLNISIGCVDTKLEILKETKSLFPDISCFSTIEESFKEDFHGYIIATPPDTHRKLAKLIISNHKPVLIEKPLALSLKDSEEIKSYLVKYDGKLIVGHLLLFHPAIKKIKSMVKEGKIGNIQYIYSNRLNLGTVRNKENVFWSFAPHDISIFQFLTNSFPSEVISAGGDFLQKKIHDTTITYLKYPNGTQGHIYTSWIHPFKEHRLVVIGSKGSLCFEDSMKNKPLLFYDKNITTENNSLFLKNNVTNKIEYKYSDPLENELKYFIKIINGNEADRANINEGIDVVKILEMASEKLNHN